MNATSPRMELERTGLLLLQDPRLPSLAALVAGGAIKGSWWGHPAGRRIFRVASELDRDPDVTTAKLLAGKVTFVHRRLFPALAAVGSERATWQTTGLSRAAAVLLERVDVERTVAAAGPAAKELVLRLLVASRQIHTPSGAHATELLTWAEFARRAKVRTVSSSGGRRKIEAAAELLAPGRGPRLLPW